MASQAILVPESRVDRPGLPETFRQRLVTRKAERLQTGPKQASILRSMRFMTGGTFTRREGGMQCRLFEPSRLVGVTGEAKGLLRGLEQGTIRTLMGIMTKSAIPLSGRGMDMAPLGLSGHLRVTLHAEFPHRFFQCRLFAGRGFGMA